MDHTNLATAMEGAEGCRDDLRCPIQRLQRASRIGFKGSECSKVWVAQACPRSCHGCQGAQMSDSFKFALANLSRALRHHTSELEGHSGQIPQQGRVYWRLAAQPHVRNICEIGFNGGHSALLWMMANPAARVVAFDLFRNEVSAVAERHLHRHVAAGRLRIYKGFSQDTVGEAIADGVRCELLSIDGGHSYHSAFVDLVNARWLAAPEQHDALIDDTNANTSVSREVALDR